MIRPATLPYKLTHPRHNYVSKKEERRLLSLISQGDKHARDRIVEVNMKFVAQVAMKYANRGVPVEDLISEGAMGLIEATYRFSQGTGYRFLSYAVWWVRQRMLLLIASQSRIIAVPPNQVNVLTKMNRERIKLEARLGRQCSQEEVVAQTVRTAPIAVARTLTLNPDMEFAHDAARLDDMAADGFEIPDPAPTPEEDLLEKSQARNLSHILTALSRDEAVVLSHYFGLQTGVPKTLEQVGEIMGVTRERVRQIKVSALANAQQHVRHMAALEARKMGRWAGRRTKSVYRKSAPAGRGELSPGEQS